MPKVKVHSVRYNFVMNFILTASNFIFPLISFPYVSRVLTAAGNGKVAFAATVANYFMLVASLGIPTHGVRACAQVRDDREQLSRTVHELLAINSVTTAGVLVTYVICIMVVPQFAAERTLFAINGVNILLNMLGMNWLYQALEQYDYITARSMFFKALSLVLMFAFVHQMSDYVIYGAITVFAAAGSNTLNLLRTRRFISYRWLGDYNLRRHFKPILVLFAQTLAVSIYSNLDTVMLGFYKGDVEVGYYNATMRIKSIMLSLVTSLANVLLPRMSYYVKNHMRREFMDLMGKAVRFTVMLSAPLSFYIACFALACMSLLAGNGYLPAVPAMQAAAFALIPNGLTGVLGIQVLVPLKRERDLLHSVIVGAIVDFSLNLVVIPLYGALGAAISTTVAETSVLIYQAFCCRELLRTCSWKRSTTIYLSSALAAAVSSTLILSMIELPVFVMVIASGCLFFSIYGALLLISRDEDAWAFFKQLRTSMMRRIGRQS